MKILYCITRSTWGGAQENIWELIKFQNKKGNQVILVVGDNGDLTTKVRNNFPNINVIVLPELQRSIQPIKDISAIFKLKKIIKDNAPDIVHLHSSKAGVIGRLACRGLNCKVIFTVHGWSFTDGVSPKKRFLYRTIERMMEPLTDKFICVSKYDYNIGIRDKVLKHPDKACVVYNGVSDKHVAMKRSVRLPLNFIMTARFSNQKDQVSLIKAFNSVSSTNWRLLFLGEGPTMKKAKELVKNYKLENKIKFLGFQENVDKFLLNSDVFILSTHYEGLPISIIEAMSWRMPIIASDVGGDSELVGDKINGFLTNNINDITKAIDYFCESPEEVLTMGNKSFELFSKNFTLEKFLKNTQKVYDNL